MSKKVLIVDDAKFMRSLIASILSRNGYEVVGEADNGQEGVALCQKLSPDLVTMDITMPHMNGIEALEAILQNDPQASVVMISAVGQEHTIRHALMLGAKGFVVKPFTEPSLLSILQSL